MAAPLHAPHAPLHHNRLVFPEAVQGPVFDALGRLAQQGLELYAIGGYVRDFLRGQPGKDLDIVVVGDGPKAAKAFARLLHTPHVQVYGQFGTAQVVVPPNLAQHGIGEVEFVGARSESYDPDSRKPHVRPGSLQQDQLRRDFTVNALSLDVHPDRAGTLYDPFGGLDDLRQGLLRTPNEPDLTFTDDPLRMLRAARFAAQLGFAVDAAAEAALHRQAHRLRIVSIERQTDELNKLILSPHPALGFKLLHRTGLLQEVLPELAALHGVEERNGIRHKDNFFHTLKVLENIVPLTPDLWLRWAALLHDVGKARTKRFEAGHGWTFHGHDDVGARMVPKLFARLRQPQGEPMKFVQKMVRLHQRPIALTQEVVTDSALRRIVVESDPHLEELLTLCRADITTRDPRREARYLRNYELLEGRIREVLERDALRNWQPPLDGQYIMERFGLKPGREVGLLKQRLRDAILDGEVDNSAQASEAFLLQVARTELGLNV